MSNRTEESAGASFARVAGAAVAFGLVHSALASHRAKRLAERLAGERAARGGYRLAFNGVSLVLTGALAIYVYRRRGPEVYAVRGPAAWLMHAGQGAALAYALKASVDADPADLWGVGPGWRYLTGAPLKPIVDGQGPAEYEPGRPDVRGAFERTRNPLNFVVLPVLWLGPRPTAGRLALNTVFSAYALLGSWHANRMFEVRHGRAWESYERSTPLMVPRLRGKAEGAVS